MNLRDFMLFTFVGAGLWNIVLAIIGYYLYEIREQIFPYLAPILIAVGAVFIIYLIIKARKNRKKSIECPLSRHKPRHGPNITLL